MAILKNTTTNDTGFLQLPSGTTGQRPASPQNGQMRYNTTLGNVEWYDTEYSSWFPAGVITPIATGGTVTDITQSGLDYRVHTFATAGTSTFTVTRQGLVEYLIVAGGGGGGSGSCNAGSPSGGGAGGVLTGSISLSVGTYNITVGAGAANPGQGNPPRNGDNSSALGFTAIGGGGAGNADSGCTGGSVIANANSGGSGGGAMCYTGSFYRGGNGTPGQGHAGGDGKNYSVLGANYISGAGGGAGGPGETPYDGRGRNQPGANGGPGISSIISGSLTFYGGGGGSSAYFADIGHGQPGLGQSIGGGGHRGGSGTTGRVIIRYRTS